MCPMEEMYVTLFDICVQAICEPCNATMCLTEQTQKHPVGLSELVLIITAANFLLLMHMLILQPE